MRPLPSTGGPAGEAWWVCTQVGPQKSFRGGSTVSPNCLGKRHAVLEDSCPTPLGSRLLWGCHQGLPITGKQSENRGHCWHRVQSLLLRSERDCGVLSPGVEQKQSAGHLSWGPSDSSDCQRAADWFRQATTGSGICPT